MKSILIVDDESAITEMLCLFLEDEGYDTSAAANGREALSQIAADQPDLILSDLTMPRLDGWELHRLLQGDPTLRDIPLLFMSAVKPAAAITQPGIAAFLLKPFDLDDLLSLVHDLLGA